MAISSFICEDLFNRILLFVDPHTLCSMMRVSKSWKVGIEGQIKMLHDYHMLPEVEGDNYSCKTFFVLTETMKECDPVALWTKYIGTPLGTYPVASMKQIKELLENGPRLYEAIFLFKAVARPIRENEIATMDKKGRLVITKRGTEQTSTIKNIRVGISVHNATELFQHHLGKEKLRVFGDVIPQIYDQCYAPLAAPQVVFVKRGIPEASRNKNWQAQVNHLSNERPADLLPLIFQYGFDCLEGKSSIYDATSEHNVNYARTSSIVEINRRPYHVVLGDPDPIQGVGIIDFRNVSSSAIGVVPSI